MDWPWIITTASSNGNPVIQWLQGPGNTNQEWQLVNVGNGYYNLICQTDGLALDNAGSTSNGTAVTQWTQEAGNTNQAWQLELVPQSGEVYNLICATSGMALDNGGSTSTGTNVTQWTPASGNSNQQWQLVDAGNGYDNLICQTSGMALDNSGATSKFSGSFWLTWVSHMNGGMGDSWLVGRVDLNS